MSQHTMAAPYLLGRSATETERLIYQADFQSVFTRRLLEEAGIGPGMRVLDVGSGVGDVALLAAGLVGSHGAVVGIDNNPAVLVTARARATGRANVTYIEGDLNAPPVDGPFDAVVGRLVLLYQPDPVATLRSLARLVRPGGVVAFQEFNFTAESLVQSPSTPLWEQVWGWMRETMRRVGIDERIGYHLHRHYRDAGLPAPQMHASSSVGGVEWGGHAYAAETLRSMLPLVTMFGIATADEVEIDTLADRLRAETAACDGVVKSPDFIGAWARV
ncbi:MAG: methyltransferase domain-containing protein [Chloroflexota bacterium]|nr:methyltransferase domain-containing protein [Chloroflexota bacterium]